MQDVFVITSEESLTAIHLIKYNSLIVFGSGRIILMRKLSSLYKLYCF